ncbi:MAG TPA: GDP-mannose 4,6-dehydratase [Solirubrobacterales bacterium]|nr:GDP-mannose 4,6-dehydratase [Solirubrobacterales bacterium]
MTRRALITGITGQDGSYLAELLLDKGYEVHGLVRRRPAPDRPNLAGIAERLVLHEGDVTDERSVREAIGAAEPHEVYNLAAASFVPASWEQPVAGAECNALGPLRLLDAIVASGCEARFFQASSSEIFGGSGGVPQDETTPLEPGSPYGAAKAYAHLLTGAYRRRHDLFACSGILFNHESPRRPRRFVTRRVSAGAAAIKLGLAEELTLGNLDARRDWGYAPEYMEAAWLMLQADEPDDFVIGSGRAHSVAELVATAFAELGLDPERYVRVERDPSRPETDDFALADPGKAREWLGWAPRTGFEDLVRLMVRADLAPGDQQSANLRKSP